MLTYNFGILSTTGLALIMLLIGKLLVNKIGFLQKYFIPAPVVGGLIFAIINLILNVTGLAYFTFNTTVQTIAMTFFFTSVGYMASINDLKKGGIGVVIFLGIASSLIIFQNLLGVGLASIFGVERIQGILVGSIPLTGGNGTASAWGEVFENQYGIQSATALGNAVATFGLVAGGLIGGPVAKLLFSRYKKKNKIVTPVSETKEEDQSDNNSNQVDIKKGMIVIITLFACMGVAEILQPYFNMLLHLISENLTLPSYILSMLIAMVVRNVTELAFKKEIHVKENDKFGDIGLQMFLAISLTTLDLASLTKVDVAILGLFITSLILQVLLTCIFVYFVTYNLMGRNYDAIVISAGHCGFAMGATPTAIANMDAFTKKNGKSTKAYLIVPLVGAMFIDFVNALIISVFLTIFV